MNDDRHDVPEEAGSMPPEPPGPMTAVAAPEPEPRAPRTSGLAIASLVTAFLCPPVGLVLGVVAVRQIDLSKNTLRGRTLANAGIAASIVVGFMALMSAVLIPGYFLARGEAQRAKCIDNIKHVAVGMILYAQDHDSTFPPAARWCDSLRVYVKNPEVFICPAARDDEKLPTYAMSTTISGIRERDIPSPGKTIMIFECNPGRNMAGGPMMLPGEARHDGRHVVGFADGHVQAISTSELTSMNWSPGIDVSGTVPSH